ncbi:MAG: gluconokinase [Dermabacter sp.]|nr:gluconokinase [Dermabacter sp.]
MTQPPMIVMGVQGTGKSTVGAALAEAYGMAFIDGDDLHPPENKKKMASGQPLNDADRLPWLTIIGEKIAKNREEGVLTVVVCSALKRWYRELLRYYVPDLFFVHLAGPKELVASRIARRNHEYMPTTLLDSQYATLQELADFEAGVRVSIEPLPIHIVHNIERAIAAGERTA